MNASELLTDAFGRIGQGVHRVVDGADRELLTFRADAEANTIAWLVWHLSRGQDAQIADAYGTDQVWTSSGWSRRFALPFPDSATGYGHTAADVAAVDVSAELLAGYCDATQEVTLGLLATTTAEDLGRVIDERWDPPVTLGVRLNSILADDVKHLGQAEFVKGIAQRAR